MSAAYPVYKKSGALQVSLIPYNFTKHKTGALLLQAASCTDPVNKVYNWSKKIMFAFGLSDIATFLDKIEDEQPTEITYFHPVKGQANVKGAKGKRLQLMPGKDQYEGTWMFTFTDTSQETTVRVPVSKGEFEIFIALVRAAIPDIVGFRGRDTNQIPSRAPVEVGDMQEETEEDSF